MRSSASLAIGIAVLGEVEEAAAAPAPISRTHRCATHRIEKTIWGRSADERRAARQDKGAPVLALKAWLEQQLARVSGKPLIADALRYALLGGGSPVSSMTGASNSILTSSKETSVPLC
jgi:hypothetical protein